MKLIIFLGAIFFTYLISCCGSSKKIENKHSNTIKEIKKSTKIYSKDTLIFIGKTPVWIKQPEGEIKADILILPGWNFAKEKICIESNFCDKALAKGYRLILPEMLKSVYASTYFPETKAVYKTFITLTWVVDTMIPALQKEYGIFTSENNYLHGISTGARGAALVHLKTDTLFKKVVLLSGDYNNATIPNDNLMKNTYGSFEKFKKRWIDNDNPWEQSEHWTSSLYIAHGTNDNIVPVEQSKLFAEKIQKNNPKCKVLKNFPVAEHNFAFWGGETERILDFFEK